MPFNHKIDQHILETAKEKKPNAREICDRLPFINETLVRQIFAAYTFFFVLFPLGCLFEKKNTNYLLPSKDREVKDIYKLIRLSLMRKADRTTCVSHF